VSGTWPTFELLSFVSFCQSFNSNVPLILSTDFLQKFVRFVCVVMHRNLQLPNSLVTQKFLRKSRISSKKNCKTLIKLGSKLSSSILKSPQASLPTTKTPPRTTKPHFTTPNISSRSPSRMGNKTICKGDN
jgi:hypothetical protein